MRTTRKVLFAGLAASAAWAGVQAAEITTAMLDKASTDTREVLSFGMGSQGQRYSTLTQINTKTVAQLVPAWSFSFGAEKQRGQESQPVIANGKMFVTASYSRIFAIDLKTGNKLWKYEHRLPDGIMPCCDVVNRGAALFGNLVIFGTLDAQLIALDQNTGKVVWKEKVDDYAAGYSMTAAPLIAKGVLINGVSGGEFGVVGRVEGRNPMTGELLWSRPTVEGHMGYRYDKDGKQIENGLTGTLNKTWPGELWKTGGASTWMGGTYDPATGLAYFGTGNPAPWNSHLRQYRGLSLGQSIAIDGRRAAGDGRQVHLDGMSKATASVHIVNQSILSAALKVARAKLGFAQARDPSQLGQVRVNTFKTMPLPALQDAGLLKHVRVLNRDVERLFAGSAGAGLDPEAFFKALCWGIDCSLM